jgi:succinate dehydrogenase / fumarate reductase, membrane anchor subunit
MGRGTEIGKVKGLGSAKGGTHHFIAQRVTGVASILLGFWFIFSLALLPSHDFSAVTGWLAQPLVAVPMMLTIVTVFYHTRLGLQVVIEDYVHDEGLRFGTVMFMDFALIGAGALALFCVAKIAFAGASL